MLGAVALSGSLHAQRGGPPGPPPTPKLAAPVDLTGQWVSLVSEDWRYRMTTPPKGDYTGVPINGAARRAADAWDPARDEAAGDQCKAYGVGGVMRLPDTRAHQLERRPDAEDRDGRRHADAHDRISRTSRSPGGDWQGVSVANWDRSASVIGGFFRAGRRGRGGSLKVVTTKMKPGYLRKNGVPYSADAVVTEYFDRFDVPNGDSLLVVSTEIVDPAYLAQPFWTSTHFKKQTDAAGWNPTPCVAR